MRNSFIAILIVLASLSAAVAKPLSPAAEPPAATKHQAGRWELHQELPYTYAMAKVRVRSWFEAEGYVLEQEIPLGKKQESCLMLWKRDGKQIIVMLWKIDIGRTGYQQGEIKDDGNKRL